MAHHPPLPWPINQTPISDGPAVGTPPRRHPTGPGDHDASAALPTCSNDAVIAAGSELSGHCMAAVCVEDLSSVTESRNLVTRRAADLGRTGLVKDPTGSGASGGQ